MELSGYLDRIGYGASPRPDAGTLFDLHRRHLSAIPYENIDVQLDRLVDLDIERIHDKIVTQGRGGWCYEMNGLFAWALEQIGFEVRQLGGSVAREFHGRDDMFGAHLVLAVVADGAEWLCDVGFGDGFHQPVEMVVGPFEQRGFRFELARVDGYWRVTNHQHGGAPSYDFAETEVDPELLQGTCDWLRTADESIFRRWLIAQRFVEGGYETQTGLTARSVTPDGVAVTTMSSADELIGRLGDVFDLDVPEVADLWPRLTERHQEFLAEQAQQVD